jgi:Bacteriophage Lambda NinG protein
MTSLPKRRKCKVCGAYFKPTRAKDWTCSLGCGIRRSSENIVQMNAKQGPVYDKWRKGMERQVAKAPACDCVACQRRYAGLVKFLRYK